MISFAAITPHPPIIVPGIGSEADRDKVKRTIGAMEALRNSLEETDSSTILLISPHAPTSYDTFGINFSNDLSGSLSAFGHDKEFHFDNDSELSSMILDMAIEEGLPAYAFESRLDHGALVPLSFLSDDNGYKLVHLSFCMAPLELHYRYGRMIGRILESEDKRVAVIASGDLSHCLIEGAPAGYSPMGRIFDEKFITCLKSGDHDSILGLDPALIEEAGECGLRSTAILLGVLAGKQAVFEKLSYEGPFGVGYLVGEFKF